MSEQATMTREQLEAAGYDIEEWNEGYYHIWRVVEPQINEQPQWQISLSCHIDEDDVCQEAALIAATAHYRQQQELAALREMMEEIRFIAKDIHHQRTSTITGAYDICEIVKAARALRTVSESERTD